MNKIYQSENLIAVADYAKKNKNSITKVEYHTEQPPAIIFHNSKITVRFNCTLEEMQAAMQRMNVWRAKVNGMWAAAKSQEDKPSEDIALRRFKRF